MTDLQESTLTRRPALVVIDDHSLRDAVYSLLENDGYDVLAARNCRDGLKIFQRAARLIGLLVTISPKHGMSTLELAQECVRLNTDAAVLFISTDTQDKKFPIELTSGRCALLAQPFRGEELLRAVRELLAPTPMTTSSLPVLSLSPYRLER